MVEIKNEKKYVVTYPELLFIFFIFIIILVSLYPKDMLKKQILSEKANYDLSMLYLKNLLKHNPEDESLMLILAKQSLKSGNIDLAIRLLELLHQSPKRKIRQKALLLSYDLEKERYFYIKKDAKKLRQKALKRLRRVFRAIYYQGIYKDDIQKWYKESQFLQMPKEQLGILKDLLKEKPHDLKLIKDGYYLAMRVHDQEEAHKLLKLLQQYDTKEREKWLMQEYYMYMNNKQYVKAQQFLENHVQESKKYKKLLAEYYLYTKQYKKASRLYLELLDENKNDDYFIKATQALVAGKMMKKAIALMKANEDRFIKNPKIRQFIIRNYIATGDLDAAARYSNKILKREYGL